MTTPVYDRIAGDYDTTRRADPYLATRMAHLLEPRRNGRYLDLACGTGNYTIALERRGGSWTGVDASMAMVEQARGKTSSVRWECGTAENLAMNGKYDGVLCSLALHHFDDLDGVCRQVRRAMKQGRFVIFTSTPEQMRGYWLNEYFPKAMERSIEQMPGGEEVQDACLRAGFTEVERERYFVQPDLQDAFLYSGKHRPHFYLNEQVRAGISTFRLLADAAETDRGCARLSEDLQSGRFEEVFDRYENQLGDYLFLRATATALES